MTGVAGDDTALKVLSGHERVWDDNLGRWRPSSAAFPPTDPEPSVYLQSVLDSLGLGAPEVCDCFERDPCAVGAGGVAAFRAHGCEVEADPVQPPTRPIDPAHGVVRIPPQDSKSAHKRFASKLVRDLTVVYDSSA